MTYVPADLLTAIRDYGVSVVTTDLWETKLPTTHPQHDEPKRWADRGYDTLAPVANLNHHTAISGPCTSGTALAMIRGRPDLEGPLCNFHGGLDANGAAILYAIAGRRARHAGMGTALVLDAILRGERVEIAARHRNPIPPDDTDGNRRLLGWEWQHPGDATPWPDELLELIGLCNAASCEYFGWPDARSIEHETWTRRKIDLSWTGSVPALTARYLIGDDVTPAELEAACEKAVRKVLGEAIPDGQRSWAGTVKATLGTAQGLVNQLRAVHSALTAESNATQEAIARVQVDTDDIQATLAAGGGGGTPPDVEAIAEAVAVKIAERLKA